MSRIEKIIAEKIKTEITKARTEKKSLWVVVSNDCFFAAR